MGKFAMSLAAAALLLGSTAIKVDAQTQQAGAASLHALVRNATPIHEAACRGPGGWCPWGTRRVCGLLGCWCIAC